MDVVTFLATQFAFNVICDFFTKHSILLENIERELNQNQFSIKNPTDKM